MFKFFCKKKNERPIFGTVEYISKIYLCKSKFYMLVISLTQL